MLTTCRAFSVFCFARHASLRNLKARSASNIVSLKYRYLQRRSLLTDISSKPSKMRFVQFQWNGRLAVGVEETDGGDIIDVTEIDPNVPHNMRDFIAGGQNNLLAAKK